MTRAFHNLRVRFLSNVREITAKGVGISRNHRDGPKFFDADSWDNDRCQMYQNFRQIVQQPTRVNDLDETTIVPRLYERSRVSWVLLNNTKQTSLYSTP